MTLQVLSDRYVGLTLPRLAGAVHYLPLLPPVRHQLSLAGFAGGSIAGERLSVGSARFGAEVLPVPDRVA